MKDSLTPRQFARALGVGESSIKRWCDKGMIQAHVTPGKHRRIALSAALEFVREGRHDIVHPEALGLPPSSGRTSRVTDRARQQLVEALLEGNEPLSRQITVDLYLAGHSPSVICDESIAKAFTVIGDKWACGTAEVYQERRACEIALRVLHDLRGMMPQPLVGESVMAIGGTPPGDQYTLGTTMVELVLQSVHWNATSLGDNLPFETLSAALSQHQPALFWLSCSHIEDEQQFIDGYSQLFETHSGNVAFVVGGYALTEPIRRQMKYASFCDSMQQLETLANSLRAAHIGPSEDA